MFGRPLALQFDASYGQPGDLRPPKRTKLLANNEAKEHAKDQNNNQAV